MEDIYEYRTAVVDECGDVMYWVSEIGDEAAWEILEKHPEWSIRCV